MAPILATRGAGSATGFGFGASMITYPVTGFVALVSTTLSTTASTISFTDIPTDKYKHLQIRGSAHADTAGSETVGLWMRFNNDSGAGKYMFSGQKDVAGYTPGGVGSNSSDYIGVGQVKADADWSLHYSAQIVDIYDAFNTVTFKSAKFYSGHNGSTTAANRNFLYWGGGTWESTSAINTITFTLETSVFSAGTTFALYGYN